MSSLPDLVASQDALLEEAALAIPHQFDRCTFSLGHIRQPVYLCITCAVPRGICAACSVACHTDHEQLELFPKRAFRCDCPTSALSHSCTLHTHEDANTANHYGPNFTRTFCHCGRPYDARTESETMIQCLACEDWFHESCLHLREQPPPRAHSPDDDDDDLPPPLVAADDYDALVCAACVRAIPILRRYAGAPGTIMILRDAHGWTRLDHESQSDASEDESPCTGKRPAPTLLEPDAKRPRIDGCTAPPANPRAQAALDTGIGDLFLTEGFRERWCHCARCLPCLEAHPYLRDEEETYEPPEDPELGLSIDELGARALERLPRDRAIDGILAFNDMRDRFKEYLRPFAREGKVVEAADVTRFFDALREKRE